MSWQIVMPPKVRKALSKLPSRERVRIEAKIARLADTREGLDIRSVTGQSPKERLRVGDYRVTFVANAAAERIEIERIGHRSHIYRLLLLVIP